MRFKDLEKKDVIKLLKNSLVELDMLKDALTEAEEENKTLLAENRELREKNT